MILLQLPTPLFICRHSPGDPNCSSNKPYYPPDPPKTPDAEKFKILEAVEKNGHLILKVEYPNCSRCAYEGVKILIYYNTNGLQALKWSKIDPHFRDSKMRNPSEAPSPDVRLPASVTGWEDAIYIAGLMEGKVTYEFKP